MKLRRSVIEGPENLEGSSLSRANSPAEGIEWSEPTSL